MDEALIYDIDRFIKKAQNYIIDRQGWIRHYENLIEKELGEDSLKDRRRWIEDCEYQRDESKKWVEDAKHSIEEYEKKEKELENMIRKGRMYFW